MKTLLIFRHAKSSWKDEHLSDHDRPLARRGKVDAPEMGKLCYKYDLLPDLILSSTAKRARTTAELFAEAGNYHGEIRLLEALYAAPPEDYLQALSELPDEFQRVMVVGHNPGLEELLTDLTGESEVLPTAALAEVQLPIGRWEEIGDDSRWPYPGKLVHIWRPREM